MASVVKGHDGMQIAWRAVKERAYEIEYTETLTADAEWTRIGTLTASGAFGAFIDEDAERTGKATGFYRVRVRGDQ